MFAVSVLQFVSQVATPPAWLLQLEERMVNMLMSGPTSWLPKGIVHVLDREFGLPGHFKSVKCMALSVQHRVMQHDMPQWKRASERLDIAADSLSAPLAAMFWKHQLLAGQIAATNRRLQEVGVTKHDRSDDAATIQKGTYTAFRDIFYPANVVSLLATRMKRWFPTQGLGMNHRGIAIAAKPFLFDVRRHVPPCVLSAVLTSLVNGWTTGRRFQEQQTRCRLHAGCHGEDSIEHYAVCPHDWKCAMDILKISETPRTLARFMGLHLARDDRPVLLALHMFALYGAFNWLKRNQLPIDNLQ